jgi:hypothetical protein
MPHVGIQGFCTGNRQYHRAKDEETGRAMRAKKVQCVDRQQGGQHLRVLKNAERAEQTQHTKPGKHHRAEQLAYGRGAVTLDDKQAGQNTERKRHNEGVQGRRANFQSLDGGQHGDGWGNQAVAEEQGRAKKTQRHHDPAKARCQRSMRLGEGK